MRACSHVCSVSQQHAHEIRIRVNFTSRHSVSLQLQRAPYKNLSLSLLATEQPLPQVLLMSQSAVPFLTPRFNLSTFSSPQTFTPSMQVTPVKVCSGSALWAELRLDRSVCSTTSLWSQKRSPYCRKRV